MEIEFVTHDHVATCQRGIFEIKPNIDDLNRRNELEHTDFSQIESDNLENKNEIQWNICNSIKTEIILKNELDNALTSADVENCALQESISDDLATTRCITESLVELKDINHVEIKFLAKELPQTFKSQVTPTYNPTFDTIKNLLKAKQLPQTFKSQVTPTYNPTFDTIKNLLKNHNREIPSQASVREKPFKCELCCYRSNSKSLLKLHIMKHTGEKPFMCELCSYRSTVKSKLELHLRRHTGEKPFTCELCSYRSADKSHLKRHLRMHTGDKPFKCELCLYTSAEKSNLKVHLRTHTGEKPFICELCSYRAACKLNLKRHLNQHTDEKVKPFQCGECDFKALTKSRLKIHFKKHTGENCLRVNCVVTVAI